MFMLGRLRDAHRSIVINGERFPWPDELTWEEAGAVRPYWIVQVRHEDAPTTQTLAVREIRLSETSVELIDACTPEEPRMYFGAFPTWEP